MTGDFDFTNEPSDGPAAGRVCPECRMSSLQHRSAGPRGPRLECPRCGAFFASPPGHQKRGP